MNKWHKSALIGIGALVLSTVAIQASDIARGVRGNLGGLALESTSVCGEGSTMFLFGEHGLCVDIYEASAGETCPHQSIESQLQTQENANSASCTVASKKDADPWNYVSLTQAQQFCARSHKRLPTNAEWYKIVSGLRDQSACIHNSNSSKPAKTGSTDCATPAGVYDMVGNVWEWIAGEVQNGKYKERELPKSGYVSLVDFDGVVLETSLAASAEFGNDYALTSSEGTLGIIRGGFYGSGDDAGIFSQNLSVPLDFKSVGVGFRCVKDIQ